MISFHDVKWFWCTCINSHGRAKSEIKLDEVAADKHDHDCDEKMDIPGPREFENRVYDYACVQPTTADYEQPVPMLPKRTTGNNKFQYSSCTAYRTPGAKKNTGSVKI